MNPRAPPPAPAGEGPPPIAVCDDCDAVQRPLRLEAGGSMRCWRCDAVLERAGERMERALALGCAALVLLVIANAFPIARVDLQGRETAATLMSATWTLWTQDRMILAALVFTLAIILPLLQAVTAAYLLASLWLGRVPRAVGPLSRLLRMIKPWAQTEILILGILVALGKLQTLADVSPGIGLWALAAAILVVIPATSFVHTGALWAEVDKIRRRSGSVRGARG